MIPSLDVPDDSLTAIETTGSVLTVMILTAVAVQPLALVTVTV
jgi:hypothetical protein